MTEDATPDRPRGGHAGLEVRVFSALWAVGHLAHTLRKEPFFDPFSWVLVLACVLVLLRPSSPGRLGALALAQIALFADRMPVTDNHLYILAFVNAGLLVAALPLAARRQAWSADVFGAARAYAIVTFLMSYAAAALSKLNRDFLFSDASCALTMLDDAGAVVGLDRTAMAASVVEAVPFAVAGVELAIPVLLAVRPLRTVGIAVAVAFHLGISLSPTATAIDFTVVIFAVLSLLIPWGQIDAGPAVARVSARVRSLAAGDRAALGVVLLFAVMGVFQWRPGTVAGNRGWAVLAVTAVGLGAAMVVAALRARRGGAPVRLALGSFRPTHYALLLLGLANVASPYLGVKTSGTYTMYSNLDVYEGRSNHYLVPRFGTGTLQDDLVEVVDSSNEKLRSLRDDGLLLTWHELRRVLARDPEASVRYRRGGALFDYARAADNAELTSLDPVLHRLVGHRPHPEAGPDCLW